MLKVIGCMDNSDGTFESQNRVYDRKYGSPTINTCGGGDRQTKVIRKWSRNVEGKENRFGNGGYGCEQ